MQVLKSLVAKQNNEFTEKATCIQNPRKSFHKPWYPRSSTEATDLNQETLVFKMRKKMTHN